MVPVVCTGGAAISQQHIDHPWRHGALGALGRVEEVPHAVQHRLKVVLLGLAAHQKVHTTVPVPTTPTAGGSGGHHVVEVLGGVQLHAEATASAHGGVASGPGT